MTLNNFMGCDAFWLCAFDMFLIQWIIYTILHLTLMITDVCCHYGLCPFTLKVFTSFLLERRNITNQSCQIGMATQLKRLTFWVFGVMLSELNDIQCDCLVFVCNLQNDSRTGEHGSSWRGSREAEMRWRVYDRFFLFSKFLKLAGLIFISANSIECSWPFQWNQLIPCGKTERAQMMRKKLEKWDI